ncbi:MAG: hypothetical protein WDZ63_12930 [Burkholderiales bacterium]
MKATRYLMLAAMAAAMTLPAVSGARDLTVSEIQGRSSAYHGSGSRITLRADADVDQAGRGQGTALAATARPAGALQTATINGRSVDSAGRS